MFTPINQKFNSIDEFGNFLISFGYNYSSNSFKHPTKNQYIYIIHCTNSSDLWIGCSINAYIDVATPKWDKMKYILIFKFEDLNNSLIDKENRILIIPNVDFSWNF